MAQKVNSSYFWVVERQLTFFFPSNFFLFSIQHISSFYKKKTSVIGNKCIT